MKKLVEDWTAKGQHRNLITGLKTKKQRTAGENKKFRQLKEKNEL